MADAAFTTVRRALDDFKRVAPRSIGFTSVKTDGCIPMHIIRRRPAHAREIVGCFVIDHAVPGSWTRDPR